MAAAVILGGCEKSSSSFVTIDGTTLVRPDGTPFLIKGTNLGNWLNPEGYMFGFSKTNSPQMIDLMLRQLVGPDAAASIWKDFKDNYITEDDIAFIASTGANTIRLPFHYKLFTDEDYMGLSGNQDGFERMDSVVEWCRKYNLFLILDMHDAPGGQTGDNIDDSYGYPWLFRSETSQKLFCDIRKKIADHYKNEPVILGYELINEPIAPYFKDVNELNALCHQSEFDGLIQPDDPSFAHPDSMTKAIRQFCRRTGQAEPQVPADYIRCIFRSLALRYRQVIEILGGMADFPILRLHVIGGGSLNQHLMQWTADATGLPIVAGPAEGTALGNTLVQVRAAGDVGSLTDMRRIVAKSVELKSYTPNARAEWNEAYERFQTLN